MKIRRLTIEDSNEIQNLVLNKNSLFKVPMHMPEMAGRVPPFSADGSAQPGHSILFGGYSEQNELIGLTRSYLWPKMPYYTMTGQFLFNPEKSFGRYKDFINSMFGTITNEMELLGRFTYFTMTLLRPNQIRQVLNPTENFKTTSHILSHQRYDCYIEEIIPPHSQSNSPAFRDMAGGLIQEVPLCIKRFSLKYQFRTDSFQKNLLSKYLGTSDGKVNFDL